MKNSRPQILFATAVFAAVTLVTLITLNSGMTEGLVARVAAAAPVRDTPVTATIRDVDNVTSTVYRFGSDSLGSYRNGLNSVQSIIQGTGLAWELDATSSSIRKARIDLQDPVPNTGAQPPFSAAVVPFRFIDKCGIDLRNLGVGQQLNCELSITFIYNGVTYALRGDTPLYHYPDTDPARLTCLVRNATQCVSWEMIPSAVQPNGERKNIMRLVIPSTRHNQPDELLGKFYVSFDVVATNP